MISKKKKRRKKEKWKGYLSINEVFPTLFNMSVNDTKAKFKFNIPAVT